MTSSLQNSNPSTVAELPYPNPRNDIEREANFMWSSRRIVGAVWDKTPRKWWIPVGLEYANDPLNPLPPYLPPFFGGTREYVDDDDGWTEVRNSTRKYRSRRRARRTYITDN